MMASAETVILAWHYSPTNFFEDPLDVSEGAYKLRIEQGKIEVELDASTYDASPNLSETILEEIKWRFLAAQLSKRRAFALNGNSPMPPGWCRLVSRSPQYATCWRIPACR